jgi:hypothetical protein
LPGLEALAAAGDLRTGEEVEFDVVTGAGRNATRGTVLALEPMSAVQRDIFLAGGLFAYGKARS